MKNFLVGVLTLMIISTASIKAQKAIITTEEETFDTYINATTHTYLDLGNKSLLLSEIVEIAYPKYEKKHAEDYEILKDFARVKFGDKYMVNFIKDIPTNNHGQFAVEDVIVTNGHKLDLYLRAKNFFGELNQEGINIRQDDRESGHIRVDFFKYINPGQLAGLVYTFDVQLKEGGCKFSIEDILYKDLADNYTDLYPNEMFTTEKYFQTKDTPVAKYEAFKNSTFEILDPMVDKFKQFMTNSTVDTHTISALTK